jgi:lysophospholipase L1-like esterase
MKTLHVIADSISMHYGPYLEKYISPYLRYTRKELTIGNLNNPEGINGGDSSQVLSYIERCKDQNMHWDLVILNCGLHDIRFYKTGKNQTIATDYELNLNNIFDEVKKISNEVIWVRTTPVIDELHNPLKNDYKRYHADVEKYNDIADRITNSRNIWSIDLHTFCQCLGEAETYLDHIHFNNETRNLQGAFIAGQIIALCRLRHYKE